MPTPTFYYGQEDYFQRLNDLVSSLMPRCGEPPGPVSANKLLELEDNGTMVDCTAALTLTASPSTLVDGWACVVNAQGGIVTLTMPFVGGASTTTIPNGASALLSCNGTTYRLARMAGI